jgi:hypothetical protein
MIGIAALTLLGQTSREHLSISKAGQLVVVDARVSSRGFIVEEDRQERKHSRDCPKRSRYNRRERDRQQKHGQLINRSTRRLQGFHLKATLRLSAWVYPSRVILP